MWGTKKEYIRQQVRLREEAQSRNDRLERDNDRLEAKCNKLSAVAESLWNTLSRSRSFVTGEVVKYDGRTYRLGSCNAAERTWHLMPREHSENKPAVVHESLLTRPFNPDDSNALQIAQLLHLPSMSETIQAYPLQWPVGWKRTAQRAIGRFGPQKFGTSGLTISQAVDRVLRELKLMGVRYDDIVISTNLKLTLSGRPRSDQGNPTDPGVAVYWRKKRTADRTDTECMAIDLYTKVEQNIAAVAATLEAMRSIERHGGAEVLNRAFSGFLALPERTESPWRDVLGFGVNEQVTLAQVMDRYREKAKASHPDRGGSEDQMIVLNKARDMALKEIK